MDQATSTIIHAQHAAFDSLLAKYRETCLERDALRTAVERLQAEHAAPPEPEA